MKKLFSLGIIFLLLTSTFSIDNSQTNEKTYDIKVVGISPLMKVSLSEGFSNLEKIYTLHEDVKEGVWAAYAVTKFTSKRWGFEEDFKEGDKLVYEVVGKARKLFPYFGPGETNEAYEVPILNSIKNGEKWFESETTLGLPSVAPVPTNILYPIDDAFWQELSSVYDGLEEVVTELKISRDSILFRAERSLSGYMYPLQGWEFEVEVLKPYGIVKCLKIGADIDYPGPEDRSIFFKLELIDFSISPEIPRISNIQLKEYSYQEGVPDDLFLLLEFLGIKDRALSGIFNAKLEPIEKIAKVKMELKLGHVTFGELREGIFSPTKWETREYEMKQVGSVFTASFDISTWSPGGALGALYTIGTFLCAGMTGGIEGFSAELAKKGFISFPSPRFDSEPVYLSAEIIKITGTDVYGNLFEFSIEKKIETSTEKLINRWSAEKYMYAMVYSPVALSIVDPEGKRVGFFRGEVYDEVNGAFYSGVDLPVQFIFITNLKSGEYKIEVEGLESGHYDLYAGFIKDGKVIKDMVKKNESISKGNITTFTLRSPEVSVMPLNWLLVFMVATLLVAITLGVYVFKKMKSKSKPIRIAYNNETRNL